MKRVFFIALGLVLNLQVAHAYHPNEGSLELDDLVREALANNLEIKEAENKLQSFESFTQSKKGVFFPEISAEGGPLHIKLYNYDAHGNAIYGRADWNLYRGGKDLGNLDRAKIESQFSRDQLEKSIARIHREVAKVHCEMLFLLERISLTKWAVQINQEQMKVARAKRSAGYTSEADVMDFELREAILISDLNLLKQEIESKSRELALVIGRKEPASDLVVKGHLTKLGLGLDKAKILGVLKDSSLEILQAKAELQISERDRDIVKADFLPKLDLNVLYGILPPIEGTKFSPNFSDYFIFLKLTIPLFSGLETLNQKKASVFAAFAKETEVINRSRSTVTAVETLFSKLDSISERLSIEEKNILRSEKYYKLTLGEYRRGVKNSPDMIGAAERLLSARIRNLEFRRDFILTRLNLLALAGLAP